MDFDNIFFLFYLFKIFYFYAGRRITFKKIEYCSGDGWERKKIIE
jgi:hypothetical protein